MPMRASFAQMASPRPPIPPVTSAIRCVMQSSVVFGFGTVPVPSPQSPVPAFLRSFLHVPARGRLDRLVLGVAELLPRRHLLAAVPLEPRRPRRPPAAGMLLRALQPAVRVVGQLGWLPRRGRHPVAALVLGRGVDGAGDVAGGTQDE